MIGVEGIKISPCVTAGYYYNAAEMWVTYGIAKIEKKFYFGLMTIDNSYNHATGKTGDMSGTYVEEFRDLLSAVMLFREVNEFVTKTCDMSPIKTYGRVKMLKEEDDDDFTIQDLKEDIWNHWDFQKRIAAKDGEKFRIVGQFIKPLDKILRQE